MATITKRTGKGGTTYKVQIRMKGQPAETASFDRLTDARKWASDIESAIRGGRHFGTARRRSFDDLAKKYEASIADTLKSAEARQGHIAYWRTVFTGMVLAEITPAVVATFLLNTSRNPSPPVRRRPQLTARHSFTAARRTTLVL